MRRKKTAALEDDVRALLASAGASLPAPRELTHDEALRTDEVARAALERIVASPRDDAPDRQPRPERSGTRRRARSLALGSLAAVLAVILTITLLAQPWQQDHERSRPPQAGPPTWTSPPLPTFSLASFDDDDSTLQGVAADDALKDLADRAAAQPASSDGPVQEVVLDGWFLTKRAKDAPVAGADLVPTVVRRYLFPDGRMRSLETRGAPLDVHGQVEDPSAGPEPTTDETFAGPSEGADYPAHLPRDPARLIHRLVSSPVDCPVLAACLSSELINLHYSWVLPPDLVAALWRTFVGQPEVTYLGTTVDRLDRPAVGFSVPSADGTRTTILYADPETGALLGNEDVLLRGGNDFGVTPPAVTAFTALVESRRIPFTEVPERQR